ncbi:MAG TPA: hypothetical protein VIQ02_01685, partial [Jiangellaceae bacterium]
RMPPRGRPGLTARKGRALAQRPQGGLPIEIHFLAAVLVPPLLREPPQPALITATMATMARAASGRSVLVMVSPLVC